MVYVLEAGVTWDMGRGHSRRSLLWLWCVVCLVRCGSVFIFVFVFVVAFAAKIFRSFVFMGRAELQMTIEVSIQSQWDKKLIDISANIHIDTGP